MSDQLSAFTPDTQDELAKFVADNASNARRPLRPIGGGTALNDRRPANVEAIDVRLEKLNRVIDYPARDMTITVEAGMRMSDLASILKAENQRLPIDVPQAEHATLGGVIATNWSGPRRFGCGTMRDYVIGISAIDASGRLFKAGGRVVKNVAGYDLCKLLVGSHGTLAIISQVTLKLRPCPETSALVWMTFDSLQQINAVLDRLLVSATRPVAIEVLNPAAAKSLGRKCALPSNQPILCIGYEGAERETNWQVETLVAECRPFEPRSVQTLLGQVADPLWAALTDFPIAAATASFKANLLPSRTMEFLQLATESGIAAQSHAGNGIVLGHLPSSASSTAQTESILRPLRERAQSCGGNLIVLNGPANKTAAQAGRSELAAASVWTQRVKQKLDPLNLLNPTWPV